MLLLGCETQTAGRAIDPSISAYRDRMLEERAARPEPTRARPVNWQPDLPEKEALIARPATTTQPAPADVLAEIPDLVDAPQVFQARLQALKDAPRPDPRVIANYEKVLTHALSYLQMADRPQKVRLSLAECIQRALQHSYEIRYEAYNPAISRTHLVEAEAAFDAEFFLDNTAWMKQDQATASTFIPATGDTRSIRGGFRKLLPTGMQVSTSLGQQRQKNDLPPEYQTLNPVYSSSFIVAFTQPLLRGFGLDYNRSQINIRRAALDIAQETFMQKVRDALLDVERAYWALARARRQAAILAETVAQNRVTYLGIQDRLGHDATEVELKNAESRWRQREVEYLDALKAVRDAEDILENLINDPELKLSDEIEIVPTETPLVGALAIDQLAAARTALEKRNEIRQARRAIEQARIATAAAKNQTLPKLDLSFQYEVQGIGVSADSSFDNLTTNRFISYTVSAVFSYPLGNRGPQAAYRRARLQESQAVVGLHRAIDAIVQEVNGAVRTLMLRYEQIPPQLETVQAAERTLRAMQARTQEISPTYLDSELGAVERLSAARSTLLQVISDYNAAVAALEKAKGTLLDYNNVVVTDAPPEP